MCMYRQLARQVWATMVGERTQIGSLCMPGNFMSVQTFVFGSFELKVDNRGLLYDVMLPSFVGKICFGDLEFHFDKHGDTVCFNAPPSPLAKRMTPVSSDLGAVGPSPTHQPAQSVGINMIFQATDMRRAKKLTRHAVHAVAPTPREPLEWSDSTITFDLTDHLTYLPHPRKFASVVDLIVNGFRLPCW